MDTLLAEYTTRFDMMDSADKTRRNATQAFDHFQRFLDAAGIEARHVEHDHMAMFVQRLRASLAPSTCRLYLGQIRAAYRHAIRRGLLTLDPTLDIRLPTQGDVEPRVFDHEELRAMRRAVETTREDILFHGLAYTGFRKSELRCLNRDHVSFEQRQRLRQCTYRSRCRGRGGCPSASSRRTTGRHDECYRFGARNFPVERARQRT